MPEARLGGPIALIRDGDRVVIDSEKRTIDWDVNEEEQARRRVEWESSGRGTLTVKRGILLRYARDVQVSGVSLSTSTKVVRLRMNMAIYNSPQMWGPTVISMAYIYGVPMKVDKQKEERYTNRGCSTRSSWCIYGSLKPDM